MPKNPHPQHQVIAANRAARDRAAAFPGGSVRPSQMPLGRGAPGPKGSGQQMVVRAGIGGANPTESPAGAPGSMVGPAMRPGQFGGGGTAPRAPAVPQNGMRAADIANGAANGGGMVHALKKNPLLWAGAALVALFLFRRS
jgi:hypothetical protein